VLSFKGCHADYMKKPAAIKQRVQNVI